MIINNIDFDIKSINITDNTIPFSAFGKHITVANPTEIKITAETSNNNYMAIGNWVGNMLHGNYKKSVRYNGIQIEGIFPIDYTFNQYCIIVTFSADHIIGDLKLFDKQQLRKEKLKKLEEVCQKSL